MSKLFSVRERVPDYYYASEQTQSLIEILEHSSLECKEALDDVMAQFFVNTATWGLSLWEQQVGIQNNSLLPLEDRRRAVLQKLIASGNTTAEMICGIAEAITGYEATVIVNNDYSFALKFLGEKSELVEFDIYEISSIVERIKPAHLRFIVSEISWTDIDSVQLTWQYFDGTPISWVKFESMICVSSKVNASKSASQNTE